MPVSYRPTVGILSMMSIANGPLLARDLPIRPPSGYPGRKTLPRSPSRAISLRQRAGRRDDIPVVRASQLCIDLNEWFENPLELFGRGTAAGIGKIDTRLFVVVSAHRNCRLRLRPLRGNETN